MALSASQLVMDDGQQFLAKVKTGGQERLRPSHIENRDYMVGGKRRHRGEARERQVQTIHKSSSKQSLSTRRCDTSQSYTLYIALHCIVGAAPKQIPS